MAQNIIACPSSTIIQQLSGKECILRTAEFAVACCPSFNKKCFVMLPAKMSL